MSQSSLTGAQNILINFDLDPLVQTTQREVYTVFDAISQTGGMMGVIFAIVSFLVGDIQKFLFFKAWAHETFMVQKKPDLPDHHSQKRTNKGSSKETSSIKKGRGERLASHPYQNFVVDDESYGSQTQKGGSNSEADRIMRNLWNREPFIISTGHYLVYKI